MSSLVGSELPKLVARVQIPVGAINLTKLAKNPLSNFIIKANLKRIEIRYINMNYDINNMDSKRNYKFKESSSNNPQNNSTFEIERLNKKAESKFI